MVHTQVPSRRHDIRHIDTQQNVIWKECRSMLYVVIPTVILLYVFPPATCCLLMRCTILVNLANTILMFIILQNAFLVNVILVTVILPLVILVNFVALTIIILRVIKMNVKSDECHSAECHFADCRCVPF